MRRTRRRPGARIAIAVALVMAIVSGGVFAYQYTTAYAQCSALPGPNACASVIPSQIALDTAFISLFGLLAAIVIALSAGVDWQGLTVPNFALARQLEREEREFQRQQVLLENQAQQAALEAVRREQERQLAAAQAAASGVQAPATAAAVSGGGAIVQAAASAAEAQPEPVFQWELEEERPPEQDDLRRRAL
ncbi:MAG: hypothetical protein KGJ86_21710, partial [Chloroflexota bacterium]|nr:hypothetical protein [Chloroflexota bacterium]